MIRDAEHFAWSNILTFLNNLKDDGSDRKSRLYQLQIDKKDASSTLNTIFAEMFEDEKKHYAKELLTKIGLISDDLGEDQIEEKEYAQSFRKEVKSYLLGSLIIENSQTPKLFKNGQAYNFFMNVLYEFDMVNEDGKAILINGKPIRGFQALASAIRENKFFQDNVFKRKPELKKYSVFFKEYFNLDFNTDKMSDPGHYKDLLNNYLINN